MMSKGTRPPPSLSYNGSELLHPPSTVVYLLIRGSCWTCRTRRVKCDECTPSCRICRTAGLTCAGYGVRLVWDGDDDTARQRPRGRRRWIKPGDQPFNRPKDGGIVLTGLVQMRMRSP